MLTRRTPVLLLFAPALALAACHDRHEPTAPDVASPAFASLLVACDADPAARVAALIAAIEQANANPDPDVIELAPGCTYTLTTEFPPGARGLPDLRSEITINGNGATIARDPAAAHFNVFFILHPAKVTLADLTITGGHLDGSGGAIWIGGGETTITRTHFANNTASGDGGVILNLATLHIMNSTLSGNTASSRGGAISNVAGFTTITNSTISGNHAGQRGGGIVNHPGASLNLIHSTLSANTAAVGTGGGIRNGGILTLRNSLIAGNTDPFNSDLSGSATASYSLIGSAAGHVIVNGADGNIVGVAPVGLHLGSLADNGGPTWTHALLAGSPAIDAGTCTDHLGGTVTDDQRGVTRPQGFACDIGAFESEEDLLTALIALSEETPGVSRGTVNKLRDALEHARGGRLGPACNALGEYIEDLENQAGKPGKVSVEDAAALIEAAGQIRSLLGC
jgi:hypothetical protein